MSDTTLPTSPSSGLWRLTLLAASLAGVWPAAGRAQELPFEVLTDWQDHNNMGWMALNRGNLDRAASAFRYSIEVLRPYEKTEPQLMARSNADFARVLYLQKRYDEAEPLARWALLVREARPGNRSEALAQCLILLAQIEQARRQPTEAEPLLKRALDVQEKELGGGHSELTSTLEELAGVQAELGKLGDSAMNYRRALALRDAHHDANLRKAAALELRALAVHDVFATVGGSPVSLIQVEQLAKDAHVARESSSESVSSARATQRHAAVLHRAGRHEEAESLEVRAKAMRDAAETRAARARQGPR